MGNVQQMEVDLRLTHVNLQSFVMLNTFQLYNLRPTNDTLFVNSKFPLTVAIGCVFLAVTHLLMDCASFESG